MTRTKMMTSWWKWFFPQLSSSEATCGILKVLTTCHSYAFEFISLAILQLFWNSADYLARLSVHLKGTPWTFRKHSYILWLKCMHVHLLSHAYIWILFFGWSHSSLFLLPCHHHAENIGTLSRYFYENGLSKNILFVFYFGEYSVHLYVLATDSHGVMHNTDVLFLCRAMS